MHSRNHQEAVCSAQKFSKFFSLEDFETLQKKFFGRPQCTPEITRRLSAGAQKVSKFFSLEDFETLQKKFFEGPSALQKSPGGCLQRSESF